MNSKSDPVVSSVKQSVEALLKTNTFSEWLAQQKAADGDLVVINNSFIYRKPVIKTSKNEQCLCLKVKDGKPSMADLFIVKAGEINSDFKLFSAKSQNLPQLVPLNEAVEHEMQQMGSLVFVLIGELQDAECEVAVNHRLVKSLKYDPTAKKADIQNVDGVTAIIVNQLTDPETAWNAVRPTFAAGQSNDELASLETALAEAFEKLREEARKRLIVPQPGVTNRQDSVTLLSEFRSSVSQQQRLYSEALNEYSRGGHGADAHLREAMRIAYNFAEDAIKVLELLVSVADLKAVLLWCTIKEHFDAAEAFRNLPWTKSRKKPSLERYQEIISSARNRAFHNLLALDRTVEADLGGIQVGAKRLTLFLPYSRRKSSVAFDYEDREMVEVLSALSRAPEVTVPLEFWKRNEVVMECFEKLLASTEEALWILNRVRSV